VRSKAGPNRENVIGDWRKLHTEELHDLCSSPYTFFGLSDQGGRDRWAMWHIWRVGLVVRKPAEKGSHGRSWHRWADNTELNLKTRRMGRCGPD
jgi:hypothetical protein